MATTVEKPKVAEAVVEDKVESKEIPDPAATEAETKESQESAPQTQEAPIPVVDEEDDEEEEVEYSDEEEDLGEEEADFNDDDEFDEEDDGYESGDDAGEGERPKRSALAQLYDDEANFEEEEEDEEYVEDGDAAPAAGTKRPVSAVEEAEGEVEELPAKKTKTAEE